MALLDAFPPGWTLEVLGTDLSTKVLARARAATWPIAKAEEIPEAARKRYMLRGFGANEGIMKAGPEIRALVTLDRVNLNGEGWPDGPFDLVFCRNVLIYFDREAKSRVVARLLERLDAHGYLFVGHAESLGALPHARAVLPTVYAPVRDARSA
jgi:chemotaxis protein methyltransferase CheR